jgi:glycosyltransferase involved in cell wall biosynthesis
MAAITSLKPPPTTYKPSPRLRVGIVYRLERAGGVQSCAFAIIRGLNRQGITPDILWDTPPNTRLLDDAGAHANYRPIHFRIRSGWIDRLPYTLRYLANIANDVDGSKLRAEYDFFFIFYNGFLLDPHHPHIRYLSGPPLIPQLAKISPGLKGIPMRVFRWLYNQILRKKHPVYEYHSGSSYVINSQFTAALFEQAHGFALPVINPPIEIPSRGFVDQDWAQRDSITFFSRIIDYKRPDLVLELAQRYPHLRCVIMGSVPQHRQSYFQTLKDRAHAMGLHDVVFLDTPPTSRVRQELSRTRYFIFPAQNEHFGMTTVEAVAAGAVPFVHDSGGQREIVPDQRLRFEDAQFLEKFDKLLQLPVHEVNILRKDLFTHISQFSESVFTNKMLTLMEQALQSS